MSTQRLLQVLAQQIAALAAEVTPRGDVPIPQARFDAALFANRGTRLRGRGGKEFRPAAKRRQRQPHQPWPFWPKTGGSDRCPAARAGNPGAAAQEPAERSPEADLYHKLAEHQDYERRLIGMIQDRESLLGRQTTLAAQQKLQHELAALEGRLMRCRRAGAHRTQYRAQRKRFLKIYHNILMIIPGCAPGSLYSAGTRVIHPIN